ncbi:transcription factor 7-like 2 isoform X5 [Octopus sinensis]|uniref:Transcription factor 7-like 2 isoform X5 n=1 Tax=Octopus sinensis TaxID=2607531 RepID=A0A7E6EXA3_9MOLL|nr:transcription factor 7-like 2 isoform X5 [Octopus sinensis]
MHLNILHPCEKPFLLLPGVFSPTLAMGGKMSMVQPPLASLMMYNNDYSQPPPAHMGIPPVHIDPKTGLPRPPMYGYPAPPGQFPHPIYGPDFPQVQWQRPPGYPISSGAFSGPYPPSLINTSPLTRFGPPSLLPPPGLPHPGIPHPAIVTAGPKQEVMSHSQDNHRDAIFPELARNPEFYEFWRKSASYYGHSLQEQSSSHASEAQTAGDKKKPHIKKPLNAFMLFMKEMRPKVVAECTLKESAAINQILGRKWHALTKAEQAKYYDMACKEKDLHMQLYPGWSARDNYGRYAKKKIKRGKQQSEDTGMNNAKARLPWYFNDVTTDSITAEGSSGGDSYQWERTRPSIIECSNPKKCRARFGLDQQNQWCKPCRRKKKCIRFLTGEDGTASNTDGEDGNDDVMSDGITTMTTTADSMNESDCNLESPNLSPHSEHIKEQQQQKFIQNIKVESTDSAYSPPPVPRSCSSPNT